MPQADDSNDGEHPLLAKAAAMHKASLLDEAAKAYLEILSTQPRNFDATHLLGVVALQQGRLEAAQKLINAALLINPHDPAAMGNLGTTYMRDGQLEPALRWLELALKLQPESPIALTNTGTVLHHMGRSRDAIPLLRRAYAADPDSYGVCNLLGACLIKNGEPREAVKLFEKATKAEPDNAEGWANLSVALNALGEHARARECADQAVLLKPQSSTALGALGAAQFDQGRLAEAIESYRQGVALPAPSAQMLLDFANALLAGGLNEEAIEQLQRAVHLDGKNLNTRWALALAHLKPVYNSESEMAMSRRDFAEAIDEVGTWYRSSNGIIEPHNAVGVSQPFYIAYHPYNNRDLLSRYGALCALWMATLADSSQPVEPEAGKTARGSARLRLGIASAHIHDHSVWNAITRGWVYNIDQTRFEIYLFQLGPTSDEETKRARLAVPHFDDGPTSLSGWMEAIRSKELDVLIYPDIGMNPLTVQLASSRLAPLQAASWGHPETTGLPTMDLYISAEALEPDNASENYSEHLMALPNLGVYVEPLAPVSSKPGLRSLGLPANEPILLCAGAPFKYSPLYDDIWVGIAKRLRRRLFRRSRSSGGRLVFFRSRSESIDRMLETRLRASFERAGVGFDDHVSIIPNLDRSRFFGLMRESALMLDTLGFSGFNTAIQAIECELPVLAYEGEFMRGRLASAIMRRLDLHELVAATKEEFIQKAVELAGDSARLKRLRAEIVKRSSVLFHDLAPVRSLELQLTDAVAKSRAG